MRKYVAEGIGTFVLVACGCGTAVAMGCDSSIGNAAYVGTAFAFGLAIVAMAYSIGNVSGCHVNPAVSLAMFIDGRLSFTDLVGYVAAQVIGAFLGAALVGVMLGLDSGLGANALYDGSVVKSLLIELVLTFVFVMAVLGATDKIENSAVAGLAIGGALTLVHLVGIRFTGTSVNPARSLAPAVLAGGSSLACVWVFLLAPLAGGALAAVCYRAINPRE
ncbi:MAG: aquaporin [Olsenella sp.]|nr:aquaporin [Olsenella sp.]